MYIYGEREKKIVCPMPLGQAPPPMPVGADTIPHALYALCLWGLVPPSMPSMPYALCIYVCASKHIYKYKYIYIYIYIYMLYKTLKP